MIRTQIPPFGHLLSETLERHGLSLSAAAHMLGYKSKTTAHRILNDETNYDTIERFYHAIQERELCDFSQAERMALEKALEVRRIGADASRANDALWAFLQTPLREAKDISAVGYFLNEKYRSMPMSEVIRICMAEKRVRVIVINACGIMPLVAEGLQRAQDADVEIDHYIYVNDDASRTVESIRNVILAMSDPRYRCYSIYGENLRASSGGVLGGDWVIVEIELWDGRKLRWQGAILPNMVHALPMSAGCDLFSFWRHIVEAYLPATQPVHVAHRLETVDDYIRLLEASLTMEKDRSVYLGKGDIGFDFVPVELQRPAINADVPAEKIDALYAIQEQRLKNLVGKQKSTHCVTTAPSLRRFAETGIHSDHPPFMRAYTTEERKSILRHMIERVKEDPYFEIHILRETVNVRAVNICCYEGEGMIITHAEDVSDSALQRSKICITQAQFVQAVQDFFRKEILTRWVLPQESTLELLEELIASLD